MRTYTAADATWPSEVSEPVGGTLSCRAGCERLWLITTNDSLDEVEFERVL